MPAESPEDLLLRECRGRLEVAQAEIDNLKTALVTSRRIGVAMGIVMAARGVTDDAAFDVLKMESQATGRKVRDLVEDVILTGIVPTTNG